MDSTPNRRAWCWAILLLIATSSLTHARSIEFAGLTWFVKSGYGGPGPNYWSDDTSSVLVDSEGLHLRIRQETGTWYCAEVYSEQFTRCGMHRFYVVSRLDSLDPNVVFAPFLYHNDETEVDIEFSRWGQQTPGFNSQYVVQPGYAGGNLERFTSTLNGTYSTHYFNWQPDSIRFRSIHGHYPEPPSPDYLIHEWLYEGNNNPPQDSNLRIHMNLWLYQGRAPTDSQGVEVTVRSADLPLATGFTGDGAGAPRTRTRPQLLARSPFGRSTAISYSLPTAGEVKIDIADATGHVVTTLVNGRQEPGEHRVTWDVSHVPAGQLAKGVYFCRLRADTQVAVRKMVRLE